MLYNPNVKPSFVSIDVVNVLNPESNQNKVFPKILMYISVRRLHNYMIKPSNNGGLKIVVDSETKNIDK